MAESSRFVAAQGAATFAWLADGTPKTVRLVTGEPGQASRPAVSEETAHMFYLLTCRECGDPERPLTMPFGSPAERGRWAAEHTRGTGHNRWIVKDESRPVVPGAVVADSGELEAG